MTARDEAAGVARAEVLAGEPETGGALIYGSTKKAIAQWIRRNAPRREWAGASIPLNAVAPGIIRTPMTTKHTESKESRAAILELVLKQAIRAVEGRCAGRDPLGEVLARF